MIAVISKNINILPPGLTDPSIFYTLDKAEEYLKSLRYE